MTLAMRLMVKRAVKHRLERYPALFLTIMRLVPRFRGLVVEPDTELVLEGFPRSANTFAFAAFAVAQGRSVRVARHLHSPAQIAYAASRGIPAVVLIRDPVDAVTSLCVRHPGTSLAQGLKDYISFYRLVSPYRRHFVLATFEEVTSSFGSVIEKINRLFGTSFETFAGTPEQLERCMLLVEQLDRLDTGRPAVTESTVARPSAARATAKARLKSQIEQPRLGSLLHEARRVYGLFESPKARR